MDKSYDVDEIYGLFPKWHAANTTQERSRIVDDYAYMLYDTTTVDGADDFTCLMLAIEKLYLRLNALINNPDALVLYTAYFEEYEYLEFKIGK